MERSSSTSSAVAKRLWRIVRVVWYMIRKGFTKQKLMMELNLLLKRGKIAGKALRNLMAFLHHHHPHPHGGGSGSHRHQFTDPKLSYYNPKEVEFSCSDTPSFLPIQKDHQRARHGYELDAAMIAKAFEILNSEITSDGETSVMTSPSVTPLWSICRKSPAAVARRLRITDSPFPVKEEEEEEVDGHVDMKAEEFIKRFYENLKLQQGIPETPPPANWRHRREAVIFGA